MKNLSILLFSSFCQFVHAQDIHPSDIRKYQLAYDYIMADSVMKNRDLYVSPSISDLEMIFFSEQLKEYPDLKVIADSLTYNETFESYDSTVLKEIFSKSNVT